jgi:cytochrome P450
VLAEPIGSRVTFDDLAADPYPIFAQMRERDPVSWVDAAGMWFVTRRDDVVRVLSDPATFTVDTRESLIEDTFGRTMLSTDGDEQRRLRHPASPAFTPRALREHAGEVIAIKSRELIDAFLARGEADLAAEFTNPLALYSVASVLGLPVEDHQLFRAWYDDFAAALANFPRDPDVRARGRATAETFRARVRPLLARLRDEPDASVLATLAASALSEDEILSAALLIVFGGLETTQAMLGNAIWALLRHSDQLEIVRRKPDAIRAAVEESMRWDAPVQSCTRHVARRVEMHGVALEPGATVQCMLGAANRDPSHFPDPDRFDIRRANASDHLGFGVGKHFCIGAGLARLEGWIALPMLFDALAGLVLDPDRPSAPRGYEFRSPPTLHVRWTTQG